MTNIEVAEANTLRMQARIAIRGSLWPFAIKKAVIEAVDRVQLPLHKFYNENKEDTIKSFISKVLGSLSDEITSKYGEEVKKCLKQKLM